MSRPEVQLDPDRSPLHRFGFELRAWRKNRGYTLVQLGAKVHTGDDLVRLIETAQRRPTRDFAERCDSVFDACGMFIRLWESIETDKPAPQTDNPAPAASVLLTPGPGQRNMIGVDLNRRTFIGAAVAVPIIGPPAPDTGLGAGGLGDVITATAKLRRNLSAQDNVLGAGAVAPVAGHQLEILQQLARHATGRAREALVALSSAYAEFTGWLADDLGDRRAGEYWTDRALQWAHEADDETMVGYVLMRKSQRAMVDKDPAGAVSLAQAAQRRGALSPRIRAAACQHESAGHAALGDVTAFRFAIDRARDLVSSAPPLAEGERASWCISAYVDMHEADGWMRLRDPARAVTLYESGLSEWPDKFRRDEGVYLGRLAAAYAAGDQPEPSAAAASRSLALACATGSRRALDELKPLPAALGRWRTTKNVRTITAGITSALEENP